MATDTAALRLKVDSSQAKTAKRELDRLAKSGGKAERATGGLSKATGGLASSFGVLKGAIVASGIVLILRDIIQTGAEYQKAISNLSAITGATGEDLQFMSDSAKELGASTTLSATQVATAFKLIASAKPDLLESAEALKAVTEEAITLAEAASIDVADAASVLGTSLNQFSAGAKEANRFINVLAAGAKFGASEITATATALEKVGVVAKSTGLSFEETNAAIQILAESGTKAEIAGTGLKTILLRLSTQADSTINPAIVGMATAFKNLKKMSLSATEQKKLFGLEALAVAQVLTKGAEKLDTLTGKLTDTTTATEQASINVDNLSGDWDKFKSAIEAVTISMEENLDPGLRIIVQSLTDVAQGAGDAAVSFVKFSEGVFTASFLLERFKKPSGDILADLALMKQQAEELAKIEFGVASFDPSILTERSTARRKEKQAEIDLIEKTIAMENELKQEGIDKGVAAVRKGREEEFEIFEKMASDFNAVWSGTVDSFSQGVGEAFADAALDGKDVVESWSKLQDALRHQILSSVIEIGTKKAIFAAVEKASALDIFATKKTIKAAELALEGTSAVTEVGIQGAKHAAILAAATPAAIANTVATGGANVGTGIAALTAGVAVMAGVIGQAHAGLTESRSDQTILISKGEAVIQPEQNRDLRKFLKQQENNGGSRPANVNINISAIDTQAGMEFIQQNRASIANAARRISQAQGGK